MKHEITRLSAGILYILSIAYILGQAGSLELDRISISQAVVRLVPGLVVLGIDTVVINNFQKEGKERAHTDPPISVSPQKNHL